MYGRSNGRMSVDQTSAMLAVAVAFAAAWDVGSNSPRAEKRYVPKVQLRKLFRSLGSLISFETSDHRANAVLRCRAARKESTARASHHVRPLTSKPV